MNHTGYAQVLEEYTAAGLAKSYLLGDDVLGQSTSAVSFQTSYLLSDGHGSTRLLADSAGAITDRMSYDAYGIKLGTSSTVLSPQASDLGYSGEQYDNSLQMAYHRARYYDQSAGLWNRLDPYSGNHSDPQSLHKYAFCHQDPVNGIDPTGEGILTEFLTGLGLSQTLATFTAGAIVGASVNVTWTVLMGLWQHYYLGDDSVFSNGEFWYDLGLSATEGAIMGGVGAVAGLPYQGKIAGLQTIFSKEMLKYIGIPAFIKAVMGTMLSAWRDHLQGHNWTIEQISGGILFGTLFNATFDFAEVGLSRLYSGETPRRQRKVRKAYAQKYKKWLVDSPVSEAKMLDYADALKKMDEKLYWVNSPLVILAWKLSEKLARAMAE
jgi:RHS repeat-associated protein